jgi:site-specific DNA-methyltransferase (adenine-specific)
LPERVVIGDAELWHGDCRDVLPMLRGLDALVTDPPYGLGALWSGGGGGKHTSWSFKADEARAWDSEAVGWIWRVIMPFREAIVWGGHLYGLPPSRSWLIWDKKQNDQWTTGQAEMAWTNLDVPIRVFRLAQCEQASEGPKWHPTQKPLSLMAWCMKWIESKRVCDPFMGSGTTGVACAQLGRAFTGIERERRYFDIACKRIAAAQAQGKLDLPRPKAKPEQMEVLGE